jgi:RNA polymerase sigma factor (sigma-70 family)
MRATWRDAHLGEHGGTSLRRTDDELVALARDGDSGAVAELYERHRGVAGAVARRVARNGEQPDDLVAEAFARIIDVLRRGGGPTAGFRPYLVASVRNVAHQRSSRRCANDVGDDALDAALECADGTLDVIDAGDERALVAKAFVSLPERWREVLWYTVVEGRKPAEVSSTLGIAPSAVAALAFRARDGLREAYLQSHLRANTESRCSPTIEHLGAYVRGGLARRDRRTVDQHLSACSRCRGLTAELRDVNQHLRSAYLPTIAVPAAGLGILRRLGARVIELGQVALTGAVATGAVVAGVIAPAPDDVGAARVDEQVELIVPAGPVDVGGTTTTASPTSTTATTATMATTATTAMTPPTTDGQPAIVVAVSVPSASTPATSIPAISIPAIRTPAIRTPALSVTIPAVTIAEVTVTIPEVTVTIPEVTVTIPIVTIPDVTVPSLLRDL